uniref:Uncharacterized protein n=1 Tax=Kalanchoe fedtschenkoi TaxID=63787 RepID=A0A7N0V304_KALFE
MDLKAIDSIKLTFTGLRTIKQAAEAAVSMCIYTIWKERNARVFRGEGRNLHKLKKETMQELNFILAKIEKLKMSSKNIYWANKLGIDPAFIRKKKMKRDDN